MREQWYGDRRDLIKWSVLVHLAEKEGLRQILQVLYLRPSDRPQIGAGSDRFTAPVAVWRHFRDLKMVSGISKNTGIQVETFDEPFEPKNRSTYIERVIVKIRALPSGGTVTLLDPDTGILDSRGSPEHATPSEVTAIFRAQRPRDWLVLYQHASRQANWLELRRAMFRDACRKGPVLTFRADGAGKDVVFFAVRRASGSGLSGTRVGRR